MITGILSEPDQTVDVVEQVLLNCARQEMSGELIATTKTLLGAQIDWARLARESWRNGIAPLLHQHLSLKAFESFVPNESRHSLRQYYVRAAFRSQTHFAAIAELLEEFEAQRRPVMLLKGAALGLTTYRDPALRPFADIDLLIREEDLDAAKTAMLACGYTLAPELTSEKLSRRFHVNLPFVKRGERPVHVELHWSLVDRFTNYQMPHEQIWQRARRIAVGQTTGLVLEVHDAIIYLSSHLDKHGYRNQILANSHDAAHCVLDELSANRLIWFTDLHELICGNVIDWQVIEARSGQGELRDVVGATLQLLHRLLGTEVPNELFARRAPRISKRMLEWVAQWAAKSERRRAFFWKQILATRKGFELRLIRLAALWDFILPRDNASILRQAKHAGRAGWRCASLLIALLAARGRNLAKRRLSR